MDKDKKKVYPPELKLEVVRNTFKKRISSLAKQYHLSDSTIRDWRKKYDLYGEIYFTQEKKNYGRRVLTEKLLRKKVLQIKFNDVEYDKLMNKYLSYNRSASLSEAFRDILLNKKNSFELKNRADPLLIEQYIKIGSLLQKYGTNINQMIKRGNLFSTFSKHEQSVIKDTVEKVNELLKSIEEKL